MTEDNTQFHSLPPCRCTRWVSDIPTTIRVAGGVEQRWYCVHGAVISYQFIAGIVLAVQEATKAVAEVCRGVADAIVEAGCLAGLDSQLPVLEARYGRPVAVALRQFAESIYASELATQQTQERQ